MYWDNFIPLSNEVFFKCYQSSSENFIERYIIGSLDKTIIKYLTEYIKDNSDLSLIKHLPLNFGVSLLRNTNTSLPAIFPPHTDSKRDLGINLLLEKGGDNTCLELYETDNSPDYTDVINESSYWNPNNVKIYDKKSVNENVWHAFRASGIHGVSNILSRRTVLFMRFPFDSYKLFLTRKEFFIL
jgi:hypothetical protein